MEPFSYFPVFPLLGILEDFDFVIKVFVFAYIEFYLYMQLRESQLLFGIATLIASYFLLYQPIPTIFLVVLFVIFFTMGAHLQFLIQFGLYPLLRIFGIELEHPEVAEQKKMQEIQKKLQNGLELEEMEERWLEAQQKKDANYNKKMQERMQRHYI